MSEFGPEDISEGDTIVFEYGDKGRKLTQEVGEVKEFGVRTTAGGTCATP